MASTTPSGQDPDLSAAIAAFATDLRRVHLHAGKPSYRMIARTLGPGFSPATISRHLKGEILPPWDFVNHFLKFCNIPSTTITSTWLIRWVKIQTELDPIPGHDTMTEEADITPFPPAAGTECIICGSWVTNTQRHAEFHNMFIPRQWTPAAGPQSTATKPRLAGQTALKVVTT